MRLTTILRASRTPVSQLPWIGELKVAQLQRIARATGIQSSGTKSVLAARIQAALSQQLIPPPQEKNSNDWSVLSIDMGIQNLAFAHLRVPRASLTQMVARAPSRPVLTAWHRLKVSEIGDLDLQGTGVKTDGGDVAERMSNSEAGSIPSSQTIETKPPTGLKEAFSPDVYAAMAYTLITLLLSVYKPTHILIERQRFRSGGGSAVQEWTIRVGVLEGMLHAVLHTLRHARGSDIAGIEVQGIEPKRVLRYWEDLDSDTNQEGDEGTKKVRVSAREVKKAKIDLVGRWLNSSLENDISPDSGTRSDGDMGVGAAVDGKICLAADRPAVHDLAGAYLQKWRGEGTRKKRSSAAGSISEIGKLDDLADCLLQGVTWVEWQVMRERLAREGLEALETPR
jgi:cruciform cutting endonuclease 1